MLNVPPTLNSASTHEKLHTNLHILPPNFFFLICQLSKADFQNLNKQRQNKSSSYSVADFYTPTKKTLVFAQVL